MKQHKIECFDKYFHLHKFVRVHKHHWEWMNDGTRAANDWKNRTKSKREEQNFLNLDIWIDLNWFNELNFFSCCRIHASRTKNCITFVSLFGFLLFIFVRACLYLATQFHIRYNVLARFIRNQRQNKTRKIMKTSSVNATSFNSKTFKLLAHDAIDIPVFGQEQFRQSQNKCEKVVFKCA